MGRRKEEGLGGRGRRKGREIGVVRREERGDSVRQREWGRRSDRGRTEYGGRMGEV